MRRDIDQEPAINHVEHRLVRIVVQNERLNLVLVLKLPDVRKRLDSVIIEQAALLRVDRGDATMNLTRTKTALQFGRLGGDDNMCHPSIHLKCPLCTVWSGTHSQVGAGGASPTKPSGSPRSSAVAE